MKLTFAGCGSSDTDQRYYQSNMFLTSPSGKHLLIDCGTDIRHSLGELGITSKIISEWLDAVYITHLHADHIGGLEWLCFALRYSEPRKRPLLFIAAELVNDLWMSLRAGLQSLDGETAFLDTYFHVVPLQSNRSDYDGPDFAWEKHDFRIHKNIHIKSPLPLYSYALDITTYKGRTYISGDTIVLDYSIWDKYDLVFQECTTNQKSCPVHTVYNRLSSQYISAEAKAKTWLYHYQPDPPQDPVKDGFLGFVQKGQEFDI